MDKKKNQIIGPKVIDLSKETFVPFSDATNKDIPEIVVDNNINLKSSLHENLKRVFSKSLDSTLNLAKSIKTNLHEKAIKIISSISKIKPKKVYFISKNTKKDTINFVKNPFRLFLLLGACTFLVIFILFSYFKIVGTINFVQAKKDIVVENLQNAINEIAINKNFNKVFEYFNKAKIELNELNNEIKSVKNDFSKDASLVNSFENVIETGLLVSDSMLALENLSANIQNFLKDSKELDIERLKKRYISLSDFLKFQWKYFSDNSLAKIKQAKDNLDKINISLLPPKYQNQINGFKEQIAKIIIFSDEIDNLFKKFLAFIGDDVSRDYVVLLQNSSESRATGGFIGSLAFLHFQNGWLERMDFKDVYDLDGQLIDEIPSPPGIEKLSPNFRLRDANYWPDFPTSAKQIMWFLDKEKGPGVDGVIAITDRVIIDLLNSIKEINIEGFNKDFDPNDFSLITSYIVESKVNKIQPKTFLFNFAKDLMKELGARMSSNPKIYDSLLRSMSEKQIMAYSINPDIQDLFEYIGIDGGLFSYSNDYQNSINDYLLVVDTSISGNKSDKYMQMKVFQDTSINKQKEVINKVTVSRKHNWNSAEEKRLENLIYNFTGKKLNDSLSWLLGKGRNVNYMRIYVPKGSQIIGTEGINQNDVNVFEDLGYLVFAYTSTVDAGWENKISITYTLPTSDIKKDVFEYNMVFEKQAGGKNFDVEKKMNIDPSIYVMGYQGKTPQDINASEKLYNDLEKFTLTNRKSFQYLLVKS